MSVFHIPELEHIGIKTDDNIDNVSEIDGSFCVVFDISSHIKSLFTHLHSTNTEGNLVFREDSITYRSIGQRECILNDIYINIDELPYYLYESTTESITVGIELSEIKSNLTMARKDVKLMISKDSGDNVITVDLFSGDYSDEDNISYIARNSMIIKNIGHCTHSVPDYSNKALIVKHPLKDVAKIFNNCNVNNNKVTIGKSRGGILLHGEINNGITSRRLMMGSCGSNIDEDSYTLIISGKTLKSLSKITGITNASDKELGIAKVYFEPDKPIKLEINISESYGILSVYITGDS